MGNILEQWKKDFQQENENYDYSAPTGAHPDVLTEKGQEEYKKILDELRNSPISMEGQYTQAMSEIIQMKENEMKIDAEEITSVKVLHTYCPDCGAELVNKFPPMFNPYTQERQCIHHCECGKKYNLEYSYPRFAFYNDKGEEVFAHCE